MVDYREILRLAHENCSQRSIAASIHSSHHTVSETLKAAKEKHIEWPLDETVTNAQLEEILFPNKYYLHCNYLPPDFEHIHKELAKPGVTLTLLWTEYVRSCEACGKRPYMTTQFGDKYREWAKITKSLFRISPHASCLHLFRYIFGNFLQYDSMAAKKSFHLAKNLTVQSAHAEILNRLLEKM